MADFWRITDWRLPTTIGPAYERLLAAMGSADFGATVSHCVRTLTSGARRLYLFEAQGPNDDDLYYYDCEPHIARLLPAYAQRYKQLDPVACLYHAASRPGDLVMQRIRPGDIPSVGFRRRFFDEPGIVERISIVGRSASMWRGLNLSRHSSEGAFNERELDAIAGLARLALPMLSPASKIEAGSPLTASQLEQRFARAYPQLTRRENQVCARAAIGMSVEATSIDLGIGKTSVVTFRQRAYRRLGVSTPFELCGLVAS